MSSNLCSIKDFQMVCSCATNARTSAGDVGWYLKRRPRGFGRNGTEYGHRDRGKGCDQFGYGRLQAGVSTSGAGCYGSDTFDDYNIHGVMATTMGASPVLVVNGPIRHRIGMNMGLGSLGQGNRANLTIGRALRLVVRNVGGAKPGKTERSTWATR